MRFGRRYQLACAVLCGGLIMGLALGIRHVQGLFMPPMTMDRGWGRELFGFAIAVQNLVWGLAQPFAGLIADRFGSVRVLLSGCLLYAAGVYGMSQVTSPIALIVCGGVVIGVALSGTAFGWVAALWVLAALMVAVLPLSFMLSDRAAAPSAAVPAQSARAAIAEAVTHRGFWLLNLGFVACGFQLSFIAMHLPAYLVDQGMSARSGAVALAVIALANVVGTAWFGYLGGCYRQKHVLALLYTARAAAIMAFVACPLSDATLYLFAFVMGLMWLGTVPLTNGIVARIFGVQYVGTLFGFVFLGHQLGAFAGAWIGGLVADRWGSYNWVWAASVALGLLAAVLHWPIDDRTLARAPAAGALRHGAGA